ncbi:MAG: GNAT family N-acetyltransferase [Brevundimonas sp.]|jgi:RimJ/RimL family protein N-acetyltransferase|uniref:GNAT family N-acetyltransferase n=1 Tax=Brevundimonas sp. TaxID=1871086 RepID=UPI0022C8B351|nr:GNAT family N-acetyltransferase [Brevundimonas sp.]
MCVIETSPVIETRRLALRAPQPQDVPRLAAMADDYDIARMTCRMPHPFGCREAERFIVDVAAQDPRRGQTFLIEHERLGPVGVVGAFMADDPCPEVGYWVGRDFWGRGIATEALEGVLAWTRSRWRRRAAVAGHFADNPASGRVLEKAGFLYTGERRRRFSLSRGEPVETRMMSWLA